MDEVEGRAVVEHLREDLRRARRFTLIGLAILAISSLAIYFRWPDYYYTKLVAVFLLGTSAVWVACGSAAMLVLPIAIRLSRKTIELREKNKKGV